MKRGTYNLNRVGVNLRKDAPTWANRIFDFIKDKKISQADFAEKCGISEVTLAGWLLKDEGKEKEEVKEEKDEAKNKFPRANLELLEKIADAYKDEISLAYLLDIYDCKKDDEESIKGSYLLGLEDEAMERLKYYKNKKKSSLDFKDITSDEFELYPKAVLKLINFFIANLDWSKLQTAISNYSYAKFLEKYKKENPDVCDFLEKSIEVNIVETLYSIEKDPNILRYQIMKMFENFIDECFSDIYHNEIVKLIKDKQKKYSAQEECC